jgi:Domain of unknown function (DUF4234)
VRSRAGYWVGGGLVAAGVLGAVLWFVISLVRIDHEVNDFQRVPIPGEGTVQLEARKYVVYYESSTAEELVAPFRMAIADARTGTPLAIESYDSSLTYSIFGHEGSAQATVTPARSGAYAVRTDDGQTGGASVALGRSLAWPIVRGILGSFAIGGLLVGSGVTLLVVTAVRRSRARRAPVDAGSGTCFSHPDRPGRQSMSTPGNTGPLGQPRGIGFGILLFIVTIGIYSLYWVYKTHDEIQQHSGQGIGGVLGLVIWLLINPVTAFVLPSEIGKMYRKDGQEPPFSGWTGLWLFPGAILLVPAIVWFVKVQGALNRYWEGKAYVPAAAT